MQQLRSNVIGYGLRLVIHSPRLRIKQQQQWQVNCYVSCASVVLNAKPFSIKGKDLIIMSKFPTDALSPSLGRTESGTIWFNREANGSGHTTGFCSMSYLFSFWQHAPRIRIIFPSDLWFRDSIRTRPLNDTASINKASWTFWYKNYDGSWSDLRCQGYYTTLSYLVFVFSWWLIDTIS